MIEQMPEIDGRSSSKMHPLQRFHIHQAVRMMREDKPLRVEAGVWSHDAAHQDWNVVSASGRSTVALTQLRISCQTCLEKGQPATWWCMVLGSWLHRVQVVVSGDAVAHKSVRRPASVMHGQPYEELNF